MTDGWTDGWTDGRTDRRRGLQYPRRFLKKSVGIIIYQNILTILITVAAKCNIVFRKFTRYSWFFLLQIRLNVVLCIDNFQDTIGYSHFICS